MNGGISPLGPWFATAQTEGYFAGSSDADPGPQAVHGYYFKILTGQGKHARDGSYNHVIHGNMIGGFALIARPAEYGNSGVMTFIVNQQGRVHQRDLGKDTAAIAKGIRTYDPGPDWQLSPD